MIRYAHLSNDLQPSHSAACPMHARICVDRHARRSLEVMHRPRQRRVWPTLLAALWLLLPVALLAQPAAIKEYDLKAAFLYNFAQFVDWPPEAFAAADSPIVIGVLGEDPFGATLDELVSESPINGRRIVVRRYARVEEIDICHLLFVNVRNAARLKAAIGALNNRATLTVGDGDVFLDQGGMIQFVTRDNRINLRINLQAAMAAGLTLSSKLLRPAQIVTSSGR